MTGIDTRASRATIADAVVLVTGGTGSFGSTITQRFLNVGCREVRILSRDEAKQDEMRTRLADDRVKFYVGDVRDIQSVQDSMGGVDFVFHAAALKQVPSCEFFPQQAVATNVIGSDNVVRAASAHGVRSVVLLSTDKAVYPINAMGMSKALMEKGAQAFARNYPNSQTTVSCVRYGNVMCSRGSVIPLFVSQLKRNQPVTITNPEMTRFLMSLDESVSLVEYALTTAQPGDLFVRKAPACRVIDLAHALANLMNRKLSTVTIGSRHGEKVFETLLSAQERSRGEDHGDFFRVPLDARTLDYTAFTVEGEPTVATFEDFTSDNTSLLSITEIEQCLRRLPEMEPLLTSPGHT